LYSSALPGCHQSEISRKNFIKVSNIEFNVKSTVEALVTNVDGRTYGYRFAGSAKAPVTHTSFFILFPSFLAISANMLTHSNFSASSNTFWQLSPFFDEKPAG
jgi:hypothetical protein